MAWHRDCLTPRVVLSDGSARECRRRMRRRCSNVRIGKPGSLPRRDGIAEARSSRSRAEGHPRLQLRDESTTFGDDGIHVKPANGHNRRVLLGMQRTLVQNLLPAGRRFSKVLEITGVGYRAQSAGPQPAPQLGYARCQLRLPEGIDVRRRTPIRSRLVDRQQKVGQVAAESSLAQAGA